jgi:DNA-directed RNA polymerase subunit M/transcription elongation factor TFIIS
MTEFCENCNNLLTISKSIDHISKQSLLDGDTPSELSEDTEKKIDIDYKQILQDVENDNEIDSDILEQIDINDMMKNSYYKKMNNKGSIKKKIIDMKQDNENTDDNINSYLVCDNCAYYKKINNKFHVLGKNVNGTISKFDYIDENVYRNKVHLRIIPRTRNFKCLNKKCPNNIKKRAHEAAFFRKDKTTYENIYVCVACLTIKHG